MILSLPDEAEELEGGNDGLATPTTEKGPGLPQKGPVGSRVGWSCTRRRHSGPLVLPHVAWKEGASGLYCVPYT